MQDAFRRRASEQQQDVGHGRFFDMAEIPILYDLNSALLNHAASLTQELTDNCGKLEKLAPTLLNLLENESASGSCALLGDLRQRFN
jgi:hypothetical protein